MALGADDDNLLAGLLADRWTYTERHYLYRQLTNIPAQSGNGLKIKMTGSGASPQLEHLQADPTRGTVRIGHG